jgi:hypothetical protein
MALYRRWGFLIPNRDHGAIIQVVEMAVAVEFFYL